MRDKQDLLPHELVYYCVFAVRLQKQTASNQQMYYVTRLGLLQSS